MLIQLKIYLCFYNSKYKPQLKSYVSLVESQGLFLISDYLCFFFLFLEERINFLS